MYVAGARSWLTRVFFFVFLFCSDDVSNMFQSDCESNFLYYSTWQMLRIFDSIVNLILSLGKNRNCELFVLKIVWNTPSLVTQDFQSGPKEEILDMCRVLPVIL